MCQADVVMWLGKELQIQSVYQLGVQLCDPPLKMVSLFVLGNKVKYFYSL